MREKRAGLLKCRIWELDFWDEGKMGTEVIKGRAASPRPVAGDVWELGVPGIMLRWYSSKQVFFSSFPFCLTVEETTFP